jgi:hypothetical protein
VLLISILLGFRTAVGSVGNWCPEEDFRKGTGYIHLDLGERIMNMKIMVARGGIEPPTRGFSIHCGKLVILINQLIIGILGAPCAVRCITVQY